MSFLCEYRNITVNNAKDLLDHKIDKENLLTNFIFFKSHYK